MFAIVVDDRDTLLPTVHKDPRSVEVAKLVATLVAGEAMVGEVVVPSAWQ